MADVHYVPELDLKDDVTPEHENKHELQIAVSAEGKHAQRQFPHDELWRHRIAWMVKPIPANHLKDAKARGRFPWYPEKLYATEFLSLFWDLVAVAALNTFSSDQEVESSKELTIFFSFFCIYWWLWASQTLYDIRFQAEDLIHRLFKLAQILCFVYVASGAGGWNLAFLKKPDPEDISFQAFEHLQSQASFQTVSIAMAASRFVIFLQYLYITIIARRAGRPFLTQITQASSCLLSTISCIIAAAINNHTQGSCTAKVVLLYLSPLFELIGVAIAAKLATFARLPSEKIADRMSIFTLIILGEGIITLLRATKRCLEAFAGSISIVYFQIFTSVVILCELWFLIFNGFNKHLWTGRTSKILWFLLHFPFHLLLLLTMSSIKNTIVGLAYTRAIEEAAVFLTGFASALKTNFSDPLQVFATRDLLLISQLVLEPTVVNEAIFLRNANTTQINVGVNFLQYIAKVMNAIAFQAFSLSLDTRTVDAFNRLQDIPYILPSNETGEALAATTLENVNLAFQAESEFFSSLATNSFVGALWMFPAAGGVLISLCLMSFVRREKHPVEAILQDGLRLVMGVALCLLGLLDIGPQTKAYDIQFNMATYDISISTKAAAPIYTLIDKNAGLLVMVLAFGLVIVLDQLLIFFAYKRHQRRKSSFKGGT